MVGILRKKHSSHAHATISGLKACAREEGADCARGAAALSVDWPRTWNYTTQLPYSTCCYLQIPLANELLPFLAQTEDCFLCVCVCVWTL